jgi:hypothetical protein
MLRKSIREAAEEMICCLCDKDLNHALKMFEDLLAELPRDYKADGVDFLKYSIKQILTRIENEF